MDRSSKLLRDGTTPSRRRLLRRNATIAEQALWRLLRSRQLEGYKFRRQQEAGPYILDFYCASHRLAVEVDGSQHYTREGLANDAERSAYLAGLGVRVFRVTNAEVLGDAEAVTAALLRILEGER